MKKKSSTDSKLVVALERIVVSDDSGPVANVARHGAAYEYVAAEKGDVACLLFTYRDTLLCASHRTRLAVEVPTKSVAPYEA